MKDQLVTYLEKIAPLRRLAYRHRVILFIVVSAGVFGFMLHRINVLANIEPSQMQIDEKVQEVKRVKIDEDAIRQIQELEDRNITLEALFDNGRENPFQE